MILLFGQYHVTFYGIVEKIKNQAGSDKTNSYLLQSQVQVVEPDF